MPKKSKLLDQVGQVIRSDIDSEGIKKALRTLRALFEV